MANLFNNYSLGSSKRQSGICQRGEAREGRACATVSRRSDLSYVHAQPDLHGSYPNYRYQPAFRRTDIVRRRVRKDPNEDAKCEAVASLLIQGATGEVLETEVKESLAQTAPEPVHPGQIKLVTKKGRR